jgi:hypothetical protein
MKHQIKKILITIVTLCLIALVCNLAYDWSGLDQKFGMEFSFLQWYSIVIIANLLFPGKDIFKQQEEKKDDNKGPKIPRDLSSHGF